ncbi:uncharacterized protein NEMAJ01_1902 [Nematocida major]|uniref:uncharacterized protein n=1 Tax=Nematocida major TaxID=1912982 RepID=UPI00200858EE|nr:uncharacterized protein NEMAJ01_1902 [Nematocida major]KAH9387006.1 hypothetical protein NEMAJ01_1902 [Nematocida major]
MPEKAGKTIIEHSYIKIKLDIDALLEEHQKFVQNKMAFPMSIPKNGEYSILYQMLNQSVKIGVDIGSAEWEKKIDVAVHLVKMRLMHIIQFSANKNIVDFRGAIFNRFGGENPGKSEDSAKRALAKQGKAIRENLLMQTVNGKATLRNVVSEDIQRLVQTLKNLDSIDEESRESFLDVMEKHARNSRSYMTLSDNYLLKCALRDACIAYEAQHNVSEDKDIYSLDELYSLQTEDGNLVEDGLLLIKSRKEVFLTESPESIFNYLSKEGVKLLRSINYHLSGISMERELYFELLRMHKGDVKPVQCKAHSLRWINEKRSNSVGLKTFCNAVDSDLMCALFEEPDLPDATAVSTRSPELEVFLSPETQRKLEMYRMLSSTQRKHVLEAVRRYARILHVKIENSDSRISETFKDFMLWLAVCILGMATVGFVSTSGALFFAKY